MNGWQDIQSVHLSLVENFDDERASIWANFTPTESGHEMHLESVVRQLQSQISTVHIQQNRPIAAFSISTFDSSSLGGSQRN